jgi:hypothetical protein
VGLVGPVAQWVLEVPAAQANLGHLAVLGALAAQEIPVDRQALEVPADLAVPENLEAQVVQGESYQRQRFSVDP